MVLLFIYNPLVFKQLFYINESEYLLNIVSIFLARSKSSGVIPFAS